MTLYSTWQYTTNPKRAKISLMFFGKGKRKSETCSLATQTQKEKENNGKNLHDDIEEEPYVKAAPPKAAQ